MTRLRRSRAAQLPAWGQWALGLALLGLAEGVLRLVYDPRAHVFGQRETEVTGWLALAALLLTLFARRLGLAPYRRALGLAGFFYTVAHLYFSYDHILDDDWQNLLFLSRGQQAGWALGLVALLGLLPLALTSTDSAVRRLGPRWKPLHHLGPWMTLLATLHTVWIGVHFGLDPLAWTSVALLLLTALALLARRRPTRSPA